MPEKVQKQTKSKKSIKEAMEDEYQKVDPVAHVLLRPDTYVGSIEHDEREMWIHDSDSGKITLDKISFVPGFFKIFDEVLVNSRDHHVKDKTCKNIKVTINKKTGTITVWNDGNGIPIVKISVELEKDKPKVDMYVPELIFGHLLTGSNFNDDSRDDTVGGRNGYGAKLANIFSKSFIVETVYINKKDEIYKKFVQKHSENMSQKDVPTITDVKPDTKPYTKITYTPDLKRFGMDEFSEDVVNLLHKRVHDISACTGDKVSVYLNDSLIKIKKFDDFIGLHYDSELTPVTMKATELKPPTIVYEEVNERWKVGVVFDPDNGGNQVSFVNGIWTYNGGTHVEYIANQVTKKITEAIKKKNKTLNVKAQSIREHLTFFIDCIISGPAFNTQTKDTLTTKVANFGSKCELDVGFFGKLNKSGIVALVTELATQKANAGLNKSDGKKTSSVKGIPKLDDAHWAGTRRSKETRLILTEGDSAKAFAISGIKVVGRDRYGAFPLKGKLLNVRNASPVQIDKNEEFERIKKIMGLKQGVKYTDVGKLRYGGIIILTDQDVDGAHIKGLIINMLHNFWPELLQIENFIQTLNTPLVKVWKKSDADKKNPKIFYGLTEYEKWVENGVKTGDIIKWGKPKYYKGLGTSDEKEAREIFNEFDKRIISYVWEKYDTAGNIINAKNKANKKIDSLSEGSTRSKNKSKSASSDSNSNSNYSDNENLTINDFSKEMLTKSKSNFSIVKAFDEKQSDERKSWLNGWSKHNILEYNQQKVTYSEFIDKELIHFSNEDNIRSIPSVVDGFKPSLRKILYAGFKKKLNKEVKVAQFASYVAEHTAYKHGEKSMEEAIVGMAQRFPGSNNVYLFHPCGNFGFRRMGGEEHASSRYIFTYMDPITKKIFIANDECILKYQVDEGDVIEPEVYCPIIPMILVNGTKGVGTGWSTDIPPYNLMEVCKNILRKMDGKEMIKMHPFYDGFNGNVVEISTGKYRITGKFEILSYNTVKITEIPIKGFYWKSANYEEFLNTLVDDGKEKSKTKKLTSVKPDCGNNEISFTVEFKEEELQNLIKKSDNEYEEVAKYLKLVANISTTNMWLFNSKNIITHYENPFEIMEEFYEYRLNMYHERKKYHLRFLNNELEILKQKVRYIQDNIADKIHVKNKKMTELIEQLKKRSYPKLHIKLDAIDLPNSDDHNDDKEDNEEDNEEDNVKSKQSINIKSYKYLTDMKLTSLTTDKIEELNKKYAEKQKEYEDYNSTTEIELWRRELKELMEYYPQWIEKRRIEEEDDNSAKIGKDGKLLSKPKRKVTKPIKSSSSKHVDDSDDERPKKIVKKSVKTN
jgi:DNA topoisomerase-2